MGVHLRSLLPAAPGVRSGAPCDARGCKLRGARRVQAGGGLLLLLAPPPLVGDLGLRGALAALRFGGHSIRLTADLEFVWLSHRGKIGVLKSKTARNRRFLCRVAEGRQPSGRTEPLRAQEIPLSCALPPPPLGRRCPALGYCADGDGSEALITDSAEELARERKWLVRVRLRLRVGRSRLPLRSRGRR